MFPQPAFFAYSADSKYPMTSGLSGLPGMLRIHGRCMYSCRRIRSAQSILSKVCSLDPAWTSTLGNSLSSKNFGQKVILDEVSKL